MTEGEIIKKSIEAQDLSQAQAARLLGLNSRQALNNYALDVSRASTEMVFEWFKSGQADWIKEMALEIFVRRPVLERPCVCQTEIGDNGPCPRHAAVLVEES